MSLDIDLNQGRGALTLKPRTRTGYVNFNLSRCELTTWLCS